MHRCLSLLELINEICEYLNPSGTTELQSEFDDLLNFGLSCKDFLEPALDEKWYFQDSLVPLFQTFPEDIRRTTTSYYEFIDNKNGVWSPPIYLKRPPNPAEWRRFFYYSKRIKILFGNSLAPDTTLDMLCSEMPAQEQGRYLLPNLRELYLWVYGTIGRNSRTVFSPTLETVHLVPAGPHETLLALLSEIPGHCPKLHSLSLASSGRVRVYDSQIIPYIRNINTLRSLSVEKATLDFIQDASRLPQIRDFSVEGLELGEAAYYKPEHGAFSVLESLEVTRFDIEHALPILRSVSSPMLASCHLALIEEGYITVDQWNSVINAFSGFSRSITKIKLGNYGVGDSVSPFCLPSEALAPLRQFHHLTKLRVRYEGRIEIDDSFICHLADACPKLCSISLIDDLGSPFPSRAITFGGLIYLIRSCRQLRKLALYVDTINSRQALASLRKDPTTNRIIKRLNMTRSAVKEPAPIAMLLYELFPELAIIDSTSHLGPERGKSWEGIEVAIKTLRYRDSLELEGA